MFTLFFLILWAGFIALGYFVFINSLYFIPLWFVLGPVAAFILVILLLIIMMPIMKITKPDWFLKYLLVKGIFGFMMRYVLLAKITVVGKENIPKKGKLTIYANHKSQTDPLIIMSVLNRPAAFTPKISLYKIPIIANYMNYIGCLPIDREDNRRTAKTMIQAIKNVKNEHALLIFPEAGIKDRSDERILEIKAGAFQIGKKSESDFLPITLIGASKYAERKSIFKRLPIKIIIHPAVTYEETKDLTTHEIGEIIKNIINKPFEAEKK